MAADPIHGRAVAFRDETRTDAGEGTRLLYERHGRSVFAYCLRQLRDRADAEDATQATFLNAFRSLQRGVQPELEQAWLYTIAGRVCANRRRANTRRSRVETPTDLHDVEAHVQPAEPEDLSHLAQALAALPEQQRKALLMRETDGLTYREIAEALQLSQGAVEQLLFRARRSLAQTLAPAKQEKRRASVGWIQLGSLVPRLKGFFHHFMGGAAAA
jgi:RNA polymerase sigma-70 factor (ECF subfamily)